jgi:hypothetical protein
MSTVATPTARIPYRMLSAMTIAHALIVLLLWLTVLMADAQLISARLWLALFCLWLVWPLGLVLHPARSLKHVAVPSLIGLALLAPAMPVAFSFTAWSIGGFAP